MQHTTNRLTGWTPVYITSSVIIIIIAALCAVDEHWASAMIKDDGLIQIMTVILLFSGSLIALLHVINKTLPRVKWAELAYLLLIYCMREMDFHRLFTSEHVSRLKLYKGPFPLKEKLIGGAVMITIIVVLLHFAATNLPTFWRNLKDKSPWARYVVVWAILLFGAQIMDKSRIFRGLYEQITEETFELGAAMMVIFILLSFPPGLKKLLTLRKH